MGAEDIAGKSQLGKLRNIAAMIDMGMRQDHGIDTLRIEGKVAVSFFRLRPFALI
jgi:hypothetical protein